MPDAESRRFTVTEDAPAKINLALHVTGQRDDGYHLLDMLVTFTRHGDRLRFAAGSSDDFAISGRFGADLATTGNLVFNTDVDGKSTGVNIYAIRVLPGNEAP